MNASKKQALIGNVLLWFVAVTSAAILPTATTSAQEQAEVSAPIELGFESGDAAAVPPKWRVPTEGWKAELTDEDASAGERSLKLSLPGQSSAPFGNLLRMVDANPYRGQRIRLSAKIRIANGQRGRAMMWLRVDRPNRMRGFFDNMAERPIRATQWTDATIQGEVAADATRIAVGVMSHGGATVFVDEMQLSFSQAVPVQKPSPPRSLTPRGRENLIAAARLLSYVRFFHPSDQAIETTDWDSFAVRLMEAAEPAENAAQLADRLRETTSPVAPTVAVWAAAQDDAPEVLPPTDDKRWLRYWVHHGAGLIAGRGSTYSSRLEHLPIKGGEAGAATKALSTLRSVIQGNGRDQQPTSPEVFKSLGGGVCCRVPLMVAVAEMKQVRRADKTGPSTASEPTTKLNVLNRSTRLAAVANCWGVMQHFYPYFDVVETDWDQALSTALSSAAEDTDQRAFLHTLQRLVAELHDGHGIVFNRDTVSRSRLPLRLDWFGEEPTVTGTHETAPNQVEPGDCLVAIDGTNMERWRQKLSTRISAATEGWQRSRLSKMVYTETAIADPCPVRMRKPDGSEYAVQLPLCPVGTRIDPHVMKPGNGSELAPGIVYFDLNGASRDAWHETHDQLREAKGIVFDLRGYPSDAAMRMLVEIGDQRMSSARWNVPVVSMPDREGWSWRKTSWDLHPVKPKLTAEIAFLTDGRAISYAETILGIIEYYKLGEIVGGTTAGTNGNVNPFTLPGDYRVSWTGMKVLKHDGSQHHGVGIAATVPVQPTPSGIAAGRDEVLEKAVEVLIERTTSNN